METNNKPVESYYAEDPMLYVGINEKTYEIEYEFRDDYLSAGRTIKETFIYAKPFICGKSFVYRSKGWDIIDVRGNTLLDSLKSRSYYDLLLVILQSICPQQKTFLKNYWFDENIVVSINPHLLFNFIESSKNQLSFIEKQKIEKYKSKESAIAILNFKSDKLLVSLVEDIGLPSEGLISVKNFDQHWGYVTIDSFNKHELNTYLFSPIYERACSFTDGMAKIRLEGKYGFINKEGKIVIPNIYDDARSFKEGYAPVAISNHRGNLKNNDWKYAEKYRWSLIGRDNQLPINNTFAGITQVNNGDFFCVDHNNKYLPQRQAHLMSVSGERKSLFIDFTNIYFKLYNIHSNCVPWVTTQLKAIFAADLFTSQHKELGFNEWYSSPGIRYSGAYKALERLRVSIPVMPLDFEFDTTQYELDFINNNDSLMDVYGKQYEKFNQQKKKQSMDSSSNFSDFDDEKRTFDDYRGSYAQDVEDYSDQDIDDIFGGDPDAYWNID